MELQTYEDIYDEIPVFQGSPEQIGRRYAAFCHEAIRRNIRWLLQDGEIKPKLTKTFLKSVAYQERFMSDRWPWLLEEMRSVADTVGVAYEDILLLNLRAWWGTENPGVMSISEPEDGCSHLAITLQDGSVACASALDDNILLYCGPVKIVPDHGYRFITLPISGTSWGNNGMNSAGLAVSLSSLPIEGERYTEKAIGRDLALRVLLQTCSNAKEAREFCTEIPFNINLICVDRDNEVFSAHVTPLGVFEAPPLQGYAALSNHVSSDDLMYQLSRLSDAQYIENRTTRLRRGNLVRFSRDRSGQCTPDEVKAFFMREDQRDQGSIHNALTAYLIYMNPANERDTIRICRSGEPFYRRFRV